MAGEIIVTIKDGAATVETRGFKGTSCLKATEELEEELGKKVESRPTREMHEKPIRLRQNQ